MHLIINVYILSVNVNAYAYISLQFPVLQCYKLYHALYALNSHLYDRMEIIYEKRLI